jgi:hypothetical protein
MKKICINFLIFFINFISSYVGQTEEIGKEAVTYFVTPGFKAKPDAHRMYAQDQVVIHTVRM